MRGLSKGFRAGFNSNKLWNENLVSGVAKQFVTEQEHVKHMREWLLKLLKKEHVAGPYDKNYVFPFGRLFLAPLFVIPKPNNKWRTIVHLSFREKPYMYTINECLHEHMKTVQYVRFKEVVRLVSNAGVGAWIFLIDAQDAYYRVPIHPGDWKYMGIEWDDKYWVFRSLQMGLSSSPRIYTSFADAVEYVCVKYNIDIAFLNGIQQLRHYIDDFFGALPRKRDAYRLYYALFTVFEILGIPTKWEKCTAPSQRTKILGWIYDTLLQMVLLPEDKRKLLLAMIRKVLRVKRGNVKLLRKLIGRLQHASRVVFPGKAFVRKVEAILYLPQHENEEKYFPLGPIVLRDLEWWERKLSSNTPCGMSFELLLKHPSDGDIIIYTDACTEIGGGGFIRGISTTIYFQIRWTDTIKGAVEQYRDLEIDVLELLMSVAAVDLITPYIGNKTITIYNDNPGAAAALRSKAPPLGRLDLQTLVTAIADLAFEKKFYWWGIHRIVKESADMGRADKLSRFLPVPWRERVRKWDILDSCDKLFDKLWEAPRNLKDQKDVTKGLRALYGISLQEPIEQDHKPSPLEHNILREREV